MAHLAAGAWQVEPTLGTAETLASTGDLRLIRNDSLRAAITQYVTYMRFFDGSEQGARDQFHELKERLLDVAGPEFVGLLGSRGEDASPSDDLYPYPTEAAQPLEPDVARLVRDDVSHLLLWRMNEAKRGMRINRERMRQLSQRLLDQIEAARAGR